MYRLIIDIDTQIPNFFPMALPLSSVLNEFGAQSVSDLASRSPFKLCDTLLSVLNTYIFLALQNVPNSPGGHPAPTLESAISL